MIKRVLGLIVCFLLSLALFRSLTGNPPLSFMSLLEEISSFEYDYNDFYEIFTFFTDDIITNYTWWPEEDLEWYMYVVYVFRALGVFFQMLWDLIVVFVQGIWNFGQNLIFIAFDFTHLLFRLAGLVS